MHQRYIMSFVSTAMAMALSSPAMAQAVSADSSEAQSETVQPDEIIVTAQKREERVTDVPISITALSGGQLDRQGVSSVADLAKVVPGFTYQSSAYGVPIFTIRGIGLFDNSIGISPTVTVYVDQAPLPYLVMTAGAGLDVERVEALKGPQGTLFGQNATGGAINYVAAKPTDSLHAGFDLSYGRFNAITAQGYISGPISDTLSVRVSAKREYRDTWQKSETRPGDELGRRDFSAGRVLIDWEPTDRFKLELNVNGWQDKSDTLASQFTAFRATLLPPRGYTESTVAVGTRAPAPDNARVADWDPNFSFRRDDWLYQTTARADWEVSDAINLTSISAYSRYSTLAPTDSDGTNFNVFRRTIDGDIESFSQELRLTADLSAVKLTGGVNYQDDKTSERDVTTYVGSNSGIGPFRYQNFINITNQQSKTYAAFLSADVSLTETLTAQLGGRYSKQNRDFQGCLQDAGDGALAGAIAFVPVRAIAAPYAPVAAGSCVTLTSTFQPFGLVTDDLDQDNFSWRAGLNWKPDRDTLIYANVTRGYKAGSFTPLPAVFASQLTPVTQEQVTAYEMGAKASILDRMLTVSAAAFYYDYKNKQVLSSGIVPFFGTLPQLQNIPKSNVRGIELDATLQPLEGLRLRVGGTYIRSKVSQSYLTPDPVGVVVDVRGEDFPNTPRWQIMGDGQYDFAVGGGMKAFVGGGFSYRSSSNAAFGHNPQFALKAYTLVDLRAGIGTEDDRVAVEFWGRNVGNTFYWTNVNYAVDTISRAPGMPSTYGVTLRGRF